jgi:hypothetical protein
MNITIPIMCGRKRCERCHLYRAVARPGHLDDGAQMGITTRKVWVCSAIPKDLESDTDGRPLRSEACMAAQMVERKNEGA